MIVAQIAGSSVLTGDLRDRVLVLLLLLLGFQTSIVLDIVCLLLGQVLQSFFHHNIVYIA